jgi:hypothetical protein
MPPPAIAIPPFERSNFFYGLLLDAERLQKDHAFFNGKRWLLNRLALGAGVVCGLGVRTVAGTPAQWFIDAGTAIDPLGREIVVAESHPFDPAQPTDDQGRPAGSPLTTGTVEICLGYVELPIDPVPVLVPDCDGDGECAPSAIREGFVVIVRPAQAAAPPLDCTLPAFPVPPAKGLHELLTKRVLGSSLQPPADALIPIARIDLAASTIDVESGRRLVFGNAVLYELIVCLAQHIAGTATRVLRYVSGDGQSGPAGTAMPNALVVELTDTANAPVSGESVQFIVTAGGGSVAPASPNTGANGRASVTWTLGAAGAQQVTATTKDTAFAVTFRATAV